MSTYFGATAVGIRVKDGVILAADKRMSYGGFILSRSFKKLFKVRGNIGVAFAGLYGDMGGLIRILEANLKLYSMESSKEPTTLNAAKFLSALLYSYKFLPFYVEVIIGGINNGKPELFVLDPVGSVIEEDYAAAGSGATTAFGVLEESYRYDMNLKDAEKLAVNAIKAAILRDAASGDGINLLIIPVNSPVIEKDITFTFRESVKP